MHRVVVIDGAQTRRPLFIIALTDILREVFLVEGIKVANNPRLIYKSLESAGRFNYSSGGGLCGFRTLVSHPSLPLIGTLGHHRVTLWSLPPLHPLRVLHFSQLEQDGERGGGGGGLNFQAAFSLPAASGLRYTCLCFLVPPPGLGAASLRSMKEEEGELVAEGSESSSVEKTEARAKQVRQGPKARREKLPAGASDSTDTIVSLLVGTMGEIHLYWSAREE